MLSNCTLSKSLAYLDGSVTYYQATEETGDAKSAAALTRFAQPSSCLAVERCETPELSGFGAASEAAPTVLRH